MGLTGSAAWRRGSTGRTLAAGLVGGEALGLKISDVDFLRRELRVDRQRLQNGAVAAPKTARSIRTVPLDNVVTQALAAHIAPSGDGSEWMFTTSTGELLGYPAWRTVWTGAQRPKNAVVVARACRKCSSKIDTPCRNSSGTRAARPHAVRVDDARGGAGIVDAHGLRHLYASMLISGGASVKQVSTVLGHSSSVVTLRVYAHLRPGDDDRTRALVDAALDVSWSPDTTNAPRSHKGSRGPHRAEARVH